MKRFLAILVACLLCGTEAYAVLPGEELSDAKLEARARHISQELRCVVCQNQTIDDSDAPLAHDLRVLVRERLASGDTDDEVKAYIVKRYGTFVLLRPPFQPDTLALWLGPLAVLLAAGLAASIYMRQRAAARAAPELNPEEERALRRVLDQS